MKSKLLTAALVTAALIVLVTCDTGSSPAAPSPLPPDFPVVFSSVWKEDNNSVYDIVRGPRYLEINSDMSFVYTGGDIGDLENGSPFVGFAGGFSQARQPIDLDGGQFEPGSNAYNFWYYPPIVVKGKLVYEGDGYYAMVPDSGYIDLRMLKKAGGTTEDSTALPEITVQSFREYAKISPDAADPSKMIINDHPATVNGGIGFLNGTWTKQ
jgi:hypothetical protein